MQASTPWNDVAFSFSERDRHLGIRPVSQLNTWPVVSPVNASRLSSRIAAHHSGSGWLARPYPVKDSHLLFFASFPGALRVGSITSFRTRDFDFRFTLDTGRLWASQRTVETGQEQTSLTVEGGVALLLWHRGADQSDQWS